MACETGEVSDVARLSRCPGLDLNEDGVTVVWEETPLIIAIRYTRTIKTFPFQSHLTELSLKKDQINSK